MTVFSKLYGWLAAAAAVLLAIAAALLYGRHKGKQVAEQAEAVRDAAANEQAAQDTIKTQESRRETDAQVQQLPDAPAQKVADADPATAAGKLRDSWTRD